MKKSGNSRSLTFFENLFALFACCTTDRYRELAHEQVFEVEHMAAARRRQDSYSTATVAVRVINIDQLLQHRSRSKNESLNQRFQGGPAEKSQFLCDLYYAGGYQSSDRMQHMKEQQNKASNQEVNFFPQGSQQTSKFYPSSSSPGKNIQQLNKGGNESQDTNINIQELPTNETSKYSTQKSNFHHKHGSSQKPLNNQHYRRSGIEAIPEICDHKLEREISYQSNQEDLEGAI